LASDRAQISIRIPICLWRRLILQLRRRGKGESESGAFLLGPQSSASERVTAFVCYDDLDPDVYQGGVIIFHAAGYVALWEYCNKMNLRVLADAHAHPGRGVRQSPTDKRNPMIPVQGHTAVIVPNFAYTPWWSLYAAGIYEYLGDFQWRSHEASRGKRRVSLALW